MFRASSAHLQEDTVVYMHHMVLSLCMRVPGGLSVHCLSENWLWVLTQAVYRQATRNSRREWQYHTLHVYNCILLKMSTWGTKHVEENNILCINNNQCIKLVINIQSIHDARSEKHQVNFFIRLHSTYRHEWPNASYSRNTCSAADLRANSCMRVREPLTKRRRRSVIWTDKITSCKKTNCTLKYENFSRLY